MRDSGYDGPPPGDRAAAGGPEPPALDTGEGMPPPAGLPWERRHELGVGTGLVRTVRDVIVGPAAAFATMRRGGGWADPLLFAVVVGTFSAWAGQLWQMLARSLLAAATGVAAAEVAAQNSQAVFFAMFAPLVVLVFTVVGAGITHLFLILFGGAPHPYETTLRVDCFAMSVQLFAMVPFCGFLIALIWGMAVQIIGLRVAQEVPGPRAAAAVLVPFVLACLCALLFIAAAVALGGFDPAAMGI